MDEEMRHLIEVLDHPEDISAESDAVRADQRPGTCMTGPRLTWQRGRPDTAACGDHPGELPVPEVPAGDRYDVWITEPAAVYPTDTLIGDEPQPAIDHPGELPVPGVPAGDRYDVGITEPAAVYHNMDTRHWTDALGLRGEPPRWALILVSEIAHRLWKTIWRKSLISAATDPATPSRH